MHACNVPGESQSKQPSWSFRTICEWHNTKARAWSRSDVLLLCWLCWGLVRAGSKNCLKKWYLQPHSSIHPRLHVRYIEPRDKARKKLVNCLACTGHTTYHNHLAYSSLVLYLVSTGGHGWLVAWFEFLERRCAWRMYNHCAKKGNYRILLPLGMRRTINSTKCCLIFYRDSTHLFTNHLRHCV